MGPQPGRKPQGNSGPLEWTQERSGPRSGLLLAGQVACEMESRERWEEGGGWLQRAR